MLIGSNMVVTQKAVTTGEAAARLPNSTYGSNGRMGTTGLDVPRGVMVPRLREVRLGRLVTQAQLAERAGIAVSTISALEQGNHTAALATVHKLAAALGVEPAELTRPA
jgi:DNA-binding XRE family transcriptional regulator